MIQGPIKNSATKTISKACIPPTVTKHSVLPNQHGGLNIATQSFRQSNLIFQLGAKLIWLCIVSWSLEQSHHIKNKKCFKTGNLFLIIKKTLPAICAHILHLSATTFIYFKNLHGGTFKMNQVCRNSIIIWTLKYHTNIYFNTLFIKNKNTNINTN